MGNTFVFLRDKAQSKLFRYYLLCFFMSMHFFAAVLIPFFTDWAGISKFQMFILQSWFALWIFLLEIPTGVIADYFGRKYSLAIGATCVGIGALIYGNFPSFGIFLFAEFLFALAHALQSGADEALLYDILKESGKEQERAKVFGRAQSLNLLGAILAAPLGSLIASKFGLNYPMIFTAIPFFIGATIAWNLSESKLRSGSESRRYLDIAKKGVKFFIGNRTLQILTLDSVFVAIAGFYVFWFYQPLLQNAGIPILQFGLFQMLLLVTQILVSSNFERLEKLFGSTKSYLRFSAFATAFAFILVALFPNLITIIIFIVLAGGLGHTRLNLITAHMNAHIPSTERATILSFINMLRRSMNILLNPLIGFMADRSLGIILLVVGLLPLSMALFSPIKKSMFQHVLDGEKS